MILKTNLTIYFACVCLSIGAQEKLCEEKEHIEDLNAISKCVIENFKKNKNDGYLKITARNRIVRSRNKSDDNDLENIRINIAKVSVEKRILTIEEVDRSPIFENSNSFALEEQNLSFEERVDKYIKSTLIYPYNEFKAGFEDEVLITFVVDSNGSISNITSTSPKKNKSLEDAAKKTVANLPKLKPAMHEGEVVKMKYEVCVDFNLNHEGAIQDSSLAVEVNLIQLPNDFIRFDQVTEEPTFITCAHYSDFKKEKCVKETIVNNIMENMVYPFDAASEGIQGRVWVRFIVDKEGYVTRITTRGPENGSLLEKEAERLVKLLPKFLPGKHNNQYVNVEFFMPIDFELEQ
ncbi:TonB family C-terminal domain-containing protein [Tenacibaculum sp. MAR_2009_124]|uniref:energy transducer TonB n=1 Tax=Tenacibaculum sp. MAR_2009_124 TaxID=1250059 RepID=UPI00089CD089|nr:energy transducer TonB [Tenacibaculum sp. MAR_2009_124]SED17320.1 TonB family C-terminal domain-containing protein [Tenacibaculum sp. MAR_2009_124]